MQANQFPFLSPNRFTVIIRHPDCVPAIVTGVDLDGITAIALSASPVKSFEAFPAQWRDTVPTTTAKQIEDHAHYGILAHARPGGFDAEFIGAGPTPKWAAMAIRELDWTAREQRIKLRAEKEALRVAAVAQACPKDAARKADAAKERARAVNLPHPECREFFELEQRGRLVGA